MILAWPDPILSPNARTHWAPQARAKKKAREDAAWETIRQVPLEARQRIAEGNGPIPMRITFIPPDKRRRDRDNMIASLKAASDGIADGLKVNDARFVPTYLVAPPEKPGFVVVEFGA